jgi:pimeloyl-ACP methyl ester carboxylesterase
MPTIQANGIQLYYEQHGWDTPGDVLALSNGILMSTASWAYQTPALSRHYRLLLYDCRGMWQSEHPPGPYSMAQHADDLAALLDGLSIERAHIGGISYGAEISLVFALRYPERTRSLVLSSAVSQVDPLLRAMMDGWIAAARARDPELLFQVTLLLQDLGRLASDLLLFYTREFGFVELPDAFTTGSSIMPQKRNPDVFELVRGRTATAQACLTEVLGITAKLPSGYQRDLQLIKAPLFRSIDVALESLDVMAAAIPQVKFVPERIRLDRDIHAAAEANELVAREGIPFREAYQRIGAKYRRPE